jgi:hypothetical protein
MHGETLWAMSGRDDAVNTSVNDAMAADSRFLMRIVLEECGEVFGGIDSLVDVAGGVGGAATAIAAAFPNLKCSVLDLPHVVAKAPSGSNVQFVPGDMFQRIPPANAVFLKVRQLMPLYLYIYDGKVSTYMGVQIISQTLFDYFVILYRLKSELIIKKIQV